MSGTGSPETPEQGLAGVPVSPGAPGGAEGVTRWRHDEMHGEDCLCTGFDRPAVTAGMSRDELIGRIFLDQDGRKKLLLTSHIKHVLEVLDELGYSIEPPDPYADVPEGYYVTEDPDRGEVLVPIPGWAVPADQEGPEQGHTFRLVMRSRGASGLMGPGDTAPHDYRDADWWSGEEWTLEVRGWDLKAALVKASRIPLREWRRPDGRKLGDA